MLQRIEVGDSQRIGNERTCGGAAARAYRDVAFAGIADEIPDDQEISGKLHLLNDGEFAGQALLIVGKAVLQSSLGLDGAQSFQAAGEALPRDMLEITVQRESGGHVEVRERIADFLEAHVAAFGDGESAGKHVGRVFEDAVHFVVALDEKAGALELHAIGVLDRLAGLDAQHYILSVGVVFAEVVAVIRRHHREGKFLFKPEQIGVNAMFLLQALVLDLKKEIVSAENIAIGRRRIPRGFVVIFHQTFRDFALEAAREADQTPGMFSKKLFADPRLVVEASQRGF